MKNLDIVEPDVKDIDGIIAAQAASWRATYVSPENGVSKEFVDTVADGLSAEYIKERINGYITNPEDLYLVAKDEHGEVLGFIHANKRGDTNDLDAIYLSPAYTGKGIGTQLMQKYFDWADPAKPYSLEVASYNKSTIKFYEKFGYKLTDKKLPPLKGVMPIKEMKNQLIINYGLSEE